MFSHLNEIQQLVSEFESHTLSPENWTHQAHLTVGIWYLAHHPKVEATKRIRAGIQSYNLANGVKQTIDGGYHETITLFYICVIDKFLREADKSFSVDLVNELLQTTSEKKLPFEYYSKERLMSWEARTCWVESDLKSLS